MFYIKCCYDNLEEKFGVIMEINGFLPKKVEKWAFWLNFCHILVENCFLTKLVNYIWKLNTVH